MQSLAMCGFSGKSRLGYCACFLNGRASEDAEQKQMFGVLSAILHMGNLEFQFNATLKRHVARDRELLSKVARLLALNVDLLERALTTRVVNAATRSSVGRLCVRTASSSVSSSRSLLLRIGVRGAVGRERRARRGALGRGLGTLGLGLGHEYLFMARSVAASVMHICARFARSWPRRARSRPACRRAGRRP